MKGNHEALARALAFYSRIASPRRLLLLTPSIDDVAFLRAVFPKSRFFVATRETWDLNEPFPADGIVDLVVVSNVFHYSPNPSLWFKNVLGMCAYCVVQDLISRRRSPTHDGLNRDPADGGDSVRYSYASKGVHSDFRSAYDLSVLGDQIEYFEAFDGVRNEYHPEPSAPPQHFCAVIKAAASGEGRLALTPSDRTYWRFRTPGIFKSWQAMLRCRRA